jgi:hypothetical protein
MRWSVEKGIARMARPGANGFFPPRLTQPEFNGPISPVDSNDFGVVGRLRRAWAIARGSQIHPAVNLVELTALQQRECRST